MLFTLHRDKHQSKIPAYTIYTTTAYIRSQVVPSDVFYCEAEESRFFDSWMVRL